MQDKLQTLLSQINLKSDYMSFFDSGELSKIVANKNKDSYLFNINLKSTLPLEVYQELLKKLKKKYDTYKLIDVRLKCTNIDFVPDYFKYFIDTLPKKSIILKAIKNDPISYSDGVLTIEITNQKEKDELTNLEDVLSKNFNNIGVSVKSFEYVETKEEINLNIPVIKKELKIDPVIMGTIIKGKTTKIENIIGEENDLVVEVNIFGIDFFESVKSNFRIITLKITDFSDSMYSKIFVREEAEYNRLKKALKVGSWVKIKGYAKNDPYSKELVLNVRDINILDHSTESREDKDEFKRVELHTHTFMSQMDGCVDATKLVKQAHKWGHKAIAITDHNGAQSFPDVYHTVCDINKNLIEGENPFKAIYGAELTLIDDSVNIVVRESDADLIKSTYVVFDFETTGFNAGGGDSIIEVGAVKILNGEIIDRFNELINPGRKLPPRITEVTNITDDMLKGKPNEDEVIKRFIEWFKDYPMVAHNAKFDVSFLEMAYKKYNLGEFTNTVIDTLELSRTLDNNFARHSLSALVKRYDIAFDEESHHRADYDAEGTALVYHKMMQKLVAQNKEKISDLNKLVSKDEIHKYGRSYHVNILTQNKVGLKNLFKIISLANTKYLYKTPRILRSEIEAHREGLLIGSGCYESEVFIEARSKSDEELSNVVNFYDYVEIQPIECYDHLLQLGDFGSQIELIETIKKIVKVVEDSGKLLVATGDVHHLNPEDKIYREIIVNQKVPGGGRHPLAKNDIKSIPSMYFRTTKEMKEGFSFLDEELVNRIVVENPNKIADMCEIVEVIIETGGVPFSPKIAKSVETVTELVYTKAASWYGNPLPLSIEERIAKELYGDAVLDSINYDLEKNNKYSEELAFKILHDTILKGFDAVKGVIKNKLESEEDLEPKDLEKKLKKSLGGIIGGGFDVIYLIAQKLVKHSNDEGYLVGSRGSVGSSFVATMMGITEVNPLPAHYRCLKCQHSIFEDDEGNQLGKTYSSGFDLPDKVCPKCGEKLFKDGQDMPFATFLGFNADKVPDIDLNFSDLNQASAHDYTKVLFGVDNVYRAGTIGTVADKTAYGFVKGYCEDKNIMKRSAEIERLAMGCTGIKRTTGQHPGGIVVIPDYMDVFDFTPFQYPADDPNSAWRTTHFDYHAIDQDVLKLDILGHSDPTQLRMLQDLSGLDVTKVPLDDPETMGIFLSPKPLGVTKEQILCDTGTLGVPEFGTPFTIGLLMDTKPTTFSELIKISGLSHGTDVWLGNAQELIKNNVVPFKDVIGCRDDIMVYLMYKGLPPIKAFKIMEFVRKGKASKEPDAWKEHKETMEKYGIEDWFIDSCYKIKYMFPKAHAAAYVISAFRIAWFKVHMPHLYYATYFSSRITDYDIDVMIKGYDAIKRKMAEIQTKGYEATNKEAGILETLKVALEMTARGINFLPVDLNKSEANNFVVIDEKNILPSFSTIDGLGGTVANKIVEEREKAPFLSIEDLQKRSKISGTLLDKMRTMGILDNMEESSQLSLF